MQYTLYMEHLWDKVLPINTGTLITGRGLKKNKKNKPEIEEILRPAFISSKIPE